MGSVMSGQRQNPVALIASPVRRVGGGSTGPPPPSRLCPGLAPKENESSAATLLDRLYAPSDSPTKMDVGVPADYLVTTQGSRTRRTRQPCARRPRPDWSAGHRSVRQRDRHLVALGRLPHRRLGPPPDRTQQAADVGRLVPHAEDPLDHRRDARGRPHLAAETERLGAQGREGGELREVVRRQLGVRAGRDPPPRPRTPTEPARSPAATSPAASAPTPAAAGPRPARSNSTPCFSSSPPGAAIPGPALRPRTAINDCLRCRE